MWFNSNIYNDLGEKCLGETQSYKTYWQISVICVNLVSLLLILACLRNIKFRNNQQEHFLSALYTSASYLWIYYSCNFKSALISLQPLQPKLEKNLWSWCLYFFFCQQMQRHSELGETSCSFIIILIIWNCLIISDAKFDMDVTDPHYFSHLLFSQ